MRGALRVAAGGDHPGLEITTLTVRGARPGPRMVVLGGVHGDEYEGMAAAGAVFRELDSETLRGTVTVVPVSNPLAYEAGQRVTPTDGKNLARVFPGDEAGSVTERIAHALTSGVIEGADFLIDLHSAGQHNAIPLLVGCYAGEDELGRRCRDAALAFGAPVYWGHPDISPGRSLSAALELGIPCIYAECGGGGRVREADLRTYRDGVRRVLAYMGMVLAPVEAAAPPRLRLFSSGDMDQSIVAPAAGLTLPSVGLLDRVREGEVLAEIVDVSGGEPVRVRAPVDGLVIALRRTAKVRVGDRLATLAQEERGGGSG